jgi:2-phospho-L-lactate/phosphoenolpyruvate guanylyltransferase
MTAADLSRLVALVPVRSLSGAKSRLGEPLDPEERGDLVLALLRRTITAATSARSLAGVVVVSQDPEVVATARSMGAKGLLQRAGGLNEGLAEARDAAEATAIVVLPADLPRISAAEVDRLADAAAETAGHDPDRPVVLLVPDQHGTGTNALLLAPPGIVPFLFGEGSRFAHAGAARAAGASYVELAGALAFDVDTAEDLLAADLGGLDHESGR